MKKLMLIVLSIVLVLSVLAVSVCAEVADIFHTDVTKEGINPVECMCYGNLNCSHYVDQNEVHYFAWSGAFKNREKMIDFKPVSAREDVYNGLPCIFDKGGSLNDESTVVFLDGVPNLGDYLFAFHTEVKSVYIPDSVKEIGEHTFLRGCKTTIYCNESNEYVRTYAALHNMACYLIDTDKYFAPSIKYGDVNEDGVINAKDVLTFRKYLAKQVILNDLCPADCVYDCQINAKDLLALRKYLAKYDIVLGAEGK